ncbi:hypothetical protein J0H58_32315, partial [bacterium]|nr:hypothetical protein [bacterium]
MMRPLPSRLFRGWRAALVAAVAACAAPSAARAGCGGYVVIRDADGEPAAAPDHGDPMPCHGPNCTGSPARDPLAPAAPPAPHAGAKECVTFGGTADPGDARPAFPIPT